MTIIAPAPAAAPTIELAAITSPASMIPRAKIPWTNVFISIDPRIITAADIPRIARAIIPIANAAVRSLLALRLNNSRAATARPTTKANRSNPERNVSHGMSVNNSITPIRATSEITNIPKAIDAFRILLPARPNPTAAITIIPSIMASKPNP